MYEFVTGPLAWLSFGIFFVGVTVRIVSYIRGLNWQADRVTYSENISYGIKGALRSIFYWLLPLGTRSWRNNPAFSLLVFFFHVGLLMTPVFLIAHNVLLAERWGFSFWTISEFTADIWTIAVLIIGAVLILRRIAFPEIRIITDMKDYMMIVITLAPFITGFLAHYQVPNYHFWLITHIICGEIWIAAIPFTKLSHAFLFFMSRAQLGMDYGIKRGGMKGKGLAW